VVDAATELGVRVGAARVFAKRRMSRRVWNAHRFHRHGMAGHNFRHMKLWFCFGEAWDGALNLITSFRGDLVGQGPQFDHQL